MWGGGGRENQRYGYENKKCWQIESRPKFRFSTDGRVDGKKARKPIERKVCKKEKEK